MAMRRLAVAVLVVSFAVLTGTARAVDKPDPTGTWKWTVNFNGQDREFTLKLKLDSGKLTGALTGPNGQATKIQNGAFKKGTVSFNVTRERNGQKRTFKYSGKVSGDTISGKTEFEVNGEPQSRNWEAKREKD
jgi:hypothetical protein